MYIYIHIYYIYIYIYIYHKHNPLIMTAADGSIFFEKIFETNLKEKRYNIFLPRCYNDEITSHTKRHFYTDEKIF